MAEKILIISPVQVFPVRAGNRERIRSVCAELKNRGYILDFFYAGYDKELDPQHASFFNGEILQHHVEEERLSITESPFGRIKQLLNGMRCRAHKWHRKFSDGSHSARYNKSLYEYKNYGKISLLDEQIVSKKYHAVILNYSPYSFYFDLFDEETIRIIDTHDRLTDRYQLYLEDHQTPVNWHSLRYRDEKKSIAKADVVWAITEEENRHFSEMVESGPANVQTLGHLMPYQKIDCNEPGRKIVMIGSGNRLNLEGLDWFLDQVWIKLQHLDQDVQFLIAGSICNAVDSPIDDERVHLLGLFDSPEEVYSKGRLFINPMLSGTGLKIKTFEALARGKYVISTSAGATGLQNVVGDGLVCSDEPSIWIQKIISFFDHEEQAAEELERSKKKINEIYQENLNVITQSLRE